MRLARLTFCLTAILSTVSLTACASRIGSAELVHVPLPAPLLTCADHPVKPAKPRTKAVGASYLADVIAAGEDCRGKLAEVRALEAGRVR